MQNEQHITVVKVETPTLNQVQGDGGVSTGGLKAFQSLAQATPCVIATGVPLALKGRHLYGLRPFRAW
jgi:hypothetical protein